MVVREAKAMIRTLALAVLLLPAARPPEKPNILFILADDVGQEVLGCYGGESYRTPHLDALAASGMRFEHAYAMPVCHPSRTTLLLGRYPFRLSERKWGGFPAEEEGKTFAHVMKSAGYATAVTGKWQLCLMKKDLDHPKRLGFDEWAVFGWHEGPRYWEPMIYHDGKVRDDVKDRYGPDVYTDVLIDFMERHREGPFLAYYSMALCHDVTDDIGKPVPFGPGKDRYESYGEMAEAMDVQVGKLMAALDRLKLREKTVVVFTGDNGTARASYAGVRNGKLYKDKVVSIRNGKKIPGGKGTLLDRGTRVPLLASWKGVIDPGGVVDDLVDFSDVLPTFADLAGADIPGGLDGRTFAPRLRDGKASGRDWVFAEHGGKSWVRTREWKLYADGRVFDMRSDLEERRPVTDAGAADVARLREAMASLR